MKFGITIGAIILASNVAFAQVAIDMSTLERRYEDAQAAYDRNQTNATSASCVVNINCRSFLNARHYRVRSV